MTLTCRPGCAACCTAPSISSPIPGMPQGKPAGVPCIQLDAQLRCKIFGQPERPSVEMCGPVDDSGVHARAWLTRLEDLTRPG
jgi:Fe-S-cluster containining protein